MINLDDGLSDEIYAFFKYMSETGMLYLFQSSLVLPIIMPLLKWHF